MQHNLPDIPLIRMCEEQKDFNLSVLKVQKVFTYQYLNTTYMFIRVTYLLVSATTDIVVY